MTLNQLKFFKTVLKMRSVTLAADALSVSQPSVTQQIRALERELGVKLFQRTGNRLTPTPAAHSIMPPVERLLASADRIVRNAEVLRRHSAGSVTLGLNTTGGAYIMPPAIRSFVADNPTIRVDVVIENTNYICSEIEEGRVQLGFAGGPIDVRLFDIQTLMIDNLVLIITPDHPLASMAKIPLEAIPEHRIILPEVGSRTRLVFESKLRESTVRMSETLAVSSTSAVKRAVEAGLGIGVVSESAVSLEVATGFLLMKRLANVDLSRPFEMFWLRGTTLTEQTARFAEFVVRHFGKSAIVGSSSK